MKIKLKTRLHVVILKPDGVEQELITNLKLISEAVFRCEIIGFHILEILSEK